MNLNANPTSEQLGNLLRQQDDSVGHHVLWVRRTGEVELSRLPPGGTASQFEQAHPDMRMRYEPFLPGNEYVGAEAADDWEWVEELLGSLKKEWARSRGKSEVVRIAGF